MDDLLRSWGCHTTVRKYKTIRVVFEFLFIFFFFIYGGIGSLLFVVSLVLLLSYFCFTGKISTLAFCGKKRKKTKSRSRDNNKNNNNKLEAFLEKFGSLAPARYTYLDVVKMTCSFSRKLGEGGCGGVFEGRLDDGRPVAVKVLKRAKGSGKEFFNEVVSIGCTYHVNIVGLLGFCLEGSGRVLVYEFMPNGSLDKFIRTQPQQEHVGDDDDDDGVDWAKLLDIANGIARGLEYLHHGCNIGILHFDIKPHNVLLDGDYTPKISDFGLAKICRSAEGIVSMVVLEMVGGRNVEARVENTTELYFPYRISIQKELRRKHTEICY